MLSFTVVKQSNNIKIPATSLGNTRTGSRCHYAEASLDASHETVKAPRNHNHHQSPEAARISNFTSAVKGEVEVFASQRA